MARRRPDIMRPSLRRPRQGAIRRHLLLEHIHHRLRVDTRHLLRVAILRLRLTHSKRGLSLADFAGVQGCGWKS